MKVLEIAVVWLFVVCLTSLITVVYAIPTDESVATLKKSVAPCTKQR